MQHQGAKPHSVNTIDWDHSLSCISYFSFFCLC